MLYRELPARFSHKRARPLGESSPGSALENTPNQEVEFAGVLGIDHLHVVSAVGADFHFVQVRGSHRRGPVVGFQHRVTVIHVAQAKHTQLRRAVCSAHGPGERSVVNLNVEFGHAVHLEDAGGWPRAEKGEIVLPAIQARTGRHRKTAGPPQSRNSR